MMIFLLNLQTVCHESSQAVKVDLLHNVLSFNRFFLLVDGHQVSMRCPVVLLHPLHHLLIINIAKKLSQVSLLNGLERCADDMACKLANRILKSNDI